ncbi:hypothetical protein [Massilia eburnea]|uniref:hypothetical protein n=1 Tax=Massilia eburnea TaxID=1776165 RepID=UPI003D6B61D5
MRLAWSPNSTHTVWSALSRTVRAPARSDRDFVLPAKPVMIGGVPRFSIGTSPEFESEVANVLELGYRAQPAQNWSYSATAWYADYDKLRTLEAEYSRRPLPRHPGIPQPGRGPYARPRTLGALAADAALAPECGGWWCRTSIPASSPAARTPPPSAW